MKHPLPLIPKTTITSKIFFFAGQYPALFYFIFSVLLVGDFILLQERALIDAHDVLNNAVPYLKALFDLMKQYGIIGWFSSWGGGVLVLNSVFCWWRPETLLYFITSPFWVYVLQHGLATFIAGYGAYKFFREVEGHSIGASLVTGIVFTTYATTFVPEATALAGIPLFLYCFDRWVQAKSFRQSIIFILGCIYYLLSANLIFIQPYSCLLHFTLCIRFLFSKRYSKRVFFYFFATWIFYLFTQLPILLNFLAEYSAVGRTRMIMPAPIGLDFLIPLADRNVLSLFMLLMGIIILYKFKKGRIYGYWFLLAPIFRYLWNKAAIFIPFFGAFQCRVFEILPFIVIAIFSFSVNRYLPKNSQHEKMGSLLSRYQIPLFGISLLLTLIYNPAPLNYFLVAASAFLSLFLYRIYQQGKGAEKVFAVMLIGLCLFRLGYKPIHILQAGANSFKFHYHLAAIEKIKEIEKKQHDLYRVVSYGIPSGIAGYHGLQTADMAYTFYPFRYQNFWTQVLRVGSNKDLKTFEDFVGTATHHVELQISPSHNLQNKIKDLSFNTNLLALMNVKYLISRVIIESPERYGLEPLLEESMVSCQSFSAKWDGMKCRINKFLSGSKASLYRITHVSPRFFIAHKIKLFPTDEILDKALREDTLEELKTHLYLTRETLTLLQREPQQLEKSISGENNSNKIKQIHYTPDKISLEVELEESGYLIMTENYSERWSCLNNGVKTPIAPAYGTFRAIYLERGDHKIVCQFLDTFQVVKNMITNTKI